MLLGRNRGGRAVDAYFRVVRTLWSDCLRPAFQELPDPDWNRLS